VVGSLPPYFTGEAPGTILDALNLDTGLSTLMKNNVQHDHDENNGERNGRVFRFPGNFKCECIQKRKQK
jgi:hypothetical protein